MVLQEIILHCQRCAGNPRKRKQTDRVRSLQALPAGFRAPMHPARVSHRLAPAHGGRDVHHGGPPLRHNGHDKTPGPLIHTALFSYISTIFVNFWT